MCVGGDARGVQRRLHVGDRDALEGLGSRAAEQRFTTNSLREFRRKEARVYRRSDRRNGHADLQRGFDRPAPGTLLRGAVEHGIEE